MYIFANVCDGDSIGECELSHVFNSLQMCVRANIYVSMCFSIRVFG